MAAVPGRATGLLLRDYKGNKADVPVYRADAALLAELRAIMRQRPRNWASGSQRANLAT